MQVELIDGGRGEFTVTADGHEVASKSDHGLPSAEEVLSAVRRDHAASAAGG